MKIRKNIKLILAESYKWRNRELIEPQGFIEPVLTRKSFIKSNLLNFTISFVFSFLFFQFINDDFAGYVISSLSIFVGLFTSVLILIFDKYINQKKEFDAIKNPSAIANVEQHKLRNFSTQFVFISLESLLIALTLIALLLIPLLLKERYLINITEYNFENFENVNFENTTNFFVNIISISSRTFIIMLLYKYIKYLFYIFGSLGAFLMGVFKKNIKL